MKEKTSDSIAVAVPTKTLSEAEKKILRKYRPDTAVIKPRVVPMFSKFERKN